MIQGMLKSEISRLTWASLRNSLLTMQSQLRGVFARSKMDKLHELKEIEDTVQDAIEARSQFVLESALSRANDVGMQNEARPPCSPDGVTDAVVLLYPQGYPVPEAHRRSCCANATGGPDARISTRLLLRGSALTPAPRRS